MGNALFLCKNLTINKLNHIRRVTMPYPNQYFQPYQTNYQPAVPAPMDRLSYMQSQQYQASQPNQSWAYVQGEAAAKSWLVGAGQSALLLDSERPVFYIKSVDKSNVPLPLRIFDYEERIQNNPQFPNPAQKDLDDKYVTREEYNSLQGKYTEILERLNNISVSDGVDTAKKTEKANGNARNKGGTSNE